MSDPFGYSEHLKLNYYSNMAWRNLIRVDLLAVDACEIAIGNEHYPIRAGSAPTVRAQQED